MSVYTVLMPAGIPVIPDVLREARAEAGISQAELARKIGISNGFIAMIELGQRHPSMRVIQALAQELKLDIADLVKTLEEVS